MVEFGQQLENGASQAEAGRNGPAKGPEASRAEALRAVGEAAKSCGADPDSVAALNREAAASGSDRFKAAAGERSRLQAEFVALIGELSAETDPVILEGIAKTAQDIARNAKASNIRVSENSGGAVDFVMGVSPQHIVAEHSHNPFAV